MQRKKKAFLVLIITVLAVFVVGTVTTTYAWFLSRYGRGYDFELESESLTIIKYESDLVFASGDISSPGNMLVPATAKHLVGSAQRDISTLEVFDVDTETPAHTGKVATSAQAVKFTATGAFWTGEDVRPGKFKPEIRAYTATFLSGRNITEDNLISVLNAEATNNPDPADRVVARNDLVRRNEIDYFMVINYLGTSFLYFNNTFYVVKGAEETADLTIPASAEGDSTLQEWKALTHESRISYNDESLQVLDDTDAYLLLQPNTMFSFVLYVFVEKTDEELDPQINGERISIFATLRQFGRFEVNEG